MTRGCAETFHALEGIQRTQATFHIAPRGGGPALGRAGLRVEQVGHRQACTQQGAKAAYNTRFGLYPNGAGAETPQTAPPDRTGCVGGAAGGGLGKAQMKSSPGMPAVAVRHCHR